MVTISRSYANHCKIPINSHSSVKKNEIKQKVYNIATRFFRYILQNQHAIGIALWSYVSIEVGMAMSTLIPSEIVYDLESCENLVCQQWNKSIEDRNNFSSSIEFRCNSSLPNYQPFFFLENCLNDLCEYITTSGKNLNLCTDLFHQNSTNFNYEESGMTPELWNALCPKVHLRHLHPLKEIRSKYSCIENICNYYSIFNPVLDSTFIKFCENKNLEKLGKLVDRMQKLVHSLEKKIEEDDNWTRVSVVAGAIGGLIGIVGSIFSIALSVVAYKGQSMNANIRPIVIGLKNMVSPVTETISAVTAETSLLTGSSVDPISNLLGEVQELMQDVSEVISHLGYGSAAPAVTGIVGSALSGIGVAKVSGRSKGVALGEEIKAVGSKVVSTTASEILNTIRTSNGLTDRLKFKSIALQGQTFLLSNNSYQDGILQEYLNDFIFGPFKDSELTQVQGSRLKSSLEGWDKAYCYYQRPNILFCRFPLHRHLNDSGIIVPDHYMSIIAAKNIPGICYILLNELWCNWDKIFNIFFETENVHPQMGDCPWDQLALNIHEHKITAIGRCYNQTAGMKV